MQPAASHVASGGLCLAAQRPPPKQPRRAAQIPPPAWPLAASPVVAGGRQRGFSERGQGASESASTEPPPPREGYEGGRKAHIFDCINLPPPRPPQRQVQGDVLPRRICRAQPAGARDPSQTADLLFSVHSLQVRVRPSASPCRPVADRQDPSPRPPSVSRRRQTRNQAAPCVQPRMRRLSVPRRQPRSFRDTQHYISCCGASHARIQPH